MRVRRARRFAATVTLMLAVGSSAACGSPARIQTLDNQPDLARMLGAIPDGFDGFDKQVREELTRLDAACTAIDPEVVNELSAVSPGAKSYAGLVDGECHWVNSRDMRVPAPPTLIVGILADPPGGQTLDETTTVLKGERSVDGVGDRAVFDARTRTLYVLQNGRLWYLQLTGTREGVAVRSIVTVLGRALVESAPAR